ncbi:MAG: hypothetical protein ACLR5O_00770 [Romboutsia timonensis]|jgi:hypothetical protein|uniref:hypothetical protein n=1 Tax=Romboutsia timonensis TaxID=1776391 RepID=UPI0039A1322A
MIVKNCVEILFLISLIVLVFFIITILMDIKRKIRQDLIRLPEVKSLESVNNLMDTLITSEFESYRIMYLEHKQDYINREYEKKILHEVIDKISDRISISIMNNIALYYDPDSISDIIAEKVYLLVSLYVAENNRIRDDFPKNKVVR